jgi:hypothetical protein
MGAKSFDTYANLGNTKFRMESYRDAIANYDKAMRPDIAASRSAEDGYGLRANIAITSPWPNRAPIWSSAKNARSAMLIPDRSPRGNHVGSPHAGLIAYRRSEAPILRATAARGVRKLIPAGDCPSL